MALRSSSVPRKGASCPTARDRKFSIVSSKTGSGTRVDIMLSAQKITSFPSERSFWPISAMTMVPKGSPVSAIVSYLVASDQSLFERGEKEINPSFPLCRLLDFYWLLIWLGVDFSFGLSRKENLSRCKPAIVSELTKEFL